MKKMIIGLSTCVCFVANGMQSPDTQIVRADGGSQQLATISATGSGMLAVRSSEEDALAALRETVHYDGFELTGDQVMISFSKRTERDGVFTETGDAEARPYPCIRNFLELTPADGAHSFAVFKILAETEELGRLTLSDRYVDSQHPLTHQTRILSSTENDASLSTKRTVQTFVTVAGEDKPVRTEEINVPYAFTERQDDRYADAVHDRKWTIRDYVRGNGETFSRDWQDLGLVVKCPAPPPVQPAATVYHQVQHGGGAPGNPFTRWFGWGNKHET